MDLTLLLGKDQVTSKEVEVQQKQHCRVTLWIGIVPFDVSIALTVFIVTTGAKKRTGGKRDCKRHIVLVLTFLKGGMLHEPHVQIFSLAIIITNTCRQTDGQMDTATATEGA